MVRVIWFCKRCNKHIRVKEYNLEHPADFVKLCDEYCQNCIAEYEAMKSRQEEERMTFLKGGDAL